MAEERLVNHLRGGERGADARRQHEHAFNASCATVAARTAAASL